MKIFNRILFSFLVLSLAILAPSCVDQEFDVPPFDGEETGLTANTTIADLKAMVTTGEIIEITEDLIVDGVVVADDRSGNFFRSLILQDETAGIEVLINLTSAYNDYPIGRELFIKLKGLHLGIVSGVIQLGGYTYIESGAEELGDIVLLSDHIFAGKRVGEPEPKVTTINALSTEDITTVIRLENVEFANFELGQTYSDPVGRRSINRTVQDCNGNEIVVRSSGYALFAGELIPEGNGTLTAIYSVFGTTPQLFIRETSDVAFDGIRCDGGGGTGNEQLMDIIDLRTEFNGGSVVAPADRKIRGVVISDADNGNWDGRNMVIQDASGGIVVRFQDAHAFPLGQELEIIVSGQELSEFNGLLQVNFVPNANAKDQGAGTMPEPRVATVADIITNSEEWESTLVEVKDAAISGSGTFNGATDVSDGTGSIVMFTRSAATFADAAVPADPVNMIAVVSQYNDAQLVIRNLDDVGGGGNTGTGDPLDVLNETFGNQSDNQAISSSGWTNVAVKGTRTWLAKEFDSNVYAQATAFQDDNPEAEMWLITPPMNLDSPKILTFESAKAFYTHDGLSVWISTDFDGDVEAATWTELDCVLAGSGSADHDWVSSDDVDLSSFSGVGYIGFKYEGNNVSGTTSYRIDNVEIND